MNSAKLIEKVGKKIVKLRKEKKQSQVDLAFLCDFEKSNLRRIEAGKTNPTLATLHKISNALEIDIRVLFD
jgi:transcriptional regulator with XRE-family HTH domain